MKRFGFFLNWKWLKDQHLLYFLKRYNLIDGAEKALTGYISTNAFFINIIGHLSGNYFPFN